MIAAGLRLPLQLRARELIVAVLATSSGFTTAVFVAVAAYPPGPARAEITLGALFSVVGAVITLGAARMLRTGRFAVRPHAQGRPHHPLGARRAHA
jgi:hypothetical protein